jgi:acetate kinase
MTEAIMVLNAGSSSIKFALYPADITNEKARYAGEIDGIGHAARLNAEDPTGKPMAEVAIDGAATHHAALSALLDWIAANCGGIELVAAGHRVAHGGREFTAPVEITPQVMRRLEALNPLAPLHQPHNLAAIAALAKLHPKLPQVACFDTSFHVTQPSVAAAFALPRALSDAGVRRYGFHGLSYEYIAGILPDHLGSMADGKIVVAHLGHGASMCAMVRRRSVATTMGFSALDGLVMGTRCGALDPGVILYLLDHDGMDATEIGHLLYEKSGLLGVSGISDDMRDLLSSDDPHAAEAVDLFVYRIVRELGSLVAALGGLDALVFTGGIGEHSPEIRARVCRQATWLGVDLDESANLAGGPPIGKEGAAVSVLTLATNEQYVIARHTRDRISSVVRPAILRSEDHESA